MVISSHHHGDGNEIFFRKSSKIQCSSTCLLIRALVFTFLGIFFCIYTPFDLIMTDRLRMHKGLPPFELWANPPDEVAMSVYVYNYTNAEAFMSGEDNVLKVEEIGPILYRELLSHHNITRNDNDTITYLGRHTAILWEEANKINMNATIIVPNYAALSMATFLHDAPFFVKLGFNILMRQSKTEIFKKVTIQNFLWNFTDPILSTANKLIPSLAPIKNIGMLERIYADFDDTYTMYVGEKHGPARFSLIEKVGGSDNLPGYKQCDDKVTNATEGVVYGQFLTRESVLLYWRKTVCKVVKLIYERDTVWDGIDTYLYVVPNNSYDRTFPAYDDCYKGQPSLPNGLTDVSNCMYNVPIAASFPHFLYGDPAIYKNIEGLQANESLHNSFVMIEPITGVPMNSVARSQSNLVVRKISGFSDEILRFSDRVLPMFWLEYNQQSVPFAVYLLVHGASVTLKPFQVVFIAMLFLFGFYSTVRFGRQFTNSEDYQRLTKKYSKSTNNNRRNPNDTQPDSPTKTETSETNQKESEAFLDKNIIKRDSLVNSVIC